MALRLGNYSTFGSHWKELVDDLRHLRNCLRFMRTSRILDALFPVTRRKLLAAVLLSPEKWSRNRNLGIGADLATFPLHYFSGARSGSLLS